MSHINFDEVKIFDDEVSELEILKHFIAERNTEEPFHILNVGDILRKHQLWLEKMPRITPFYAVKCNPDPTVIKVIAALGGSFDCASKHEISQVMQYGVPSDRIIYANPIKFPSHIKYAKKVGVSLMTADTEDELRTIKNIYPETKIVIRIRSDAKIADVLLGDKFGCDPDEAVKLIKATIKLELSLHGFSFHVGSPCGEIMAFCRGINLCKNLIDTARSMGCKDVKMIDIGGGIPGERDFCLNEFSDIINDVIKDIDPSIVIISEPGRYYVTSAFSSAALIFGKKTAIKDGKKAFHYYVSDGAYGTFVDEILLQLRARRPTAINNPTRNNKEEYISTLWGPTLDAFDVFFKNELLPEFNIGDWVFWLDAGAYTTCLSTKFNGFEPAKVYPVITRKDWNELLTAVTKDTIKVLKKTEYIN